MKCSQLPHSTKMLLKSERGFLLYELLITIGIVSIIAGIVTLIDNPFSALTVRSEIDLLHSLCCLTQHKAMIQNRSLYITCDNNSYLVEGRPIVLSKNVIFGAPSGAKGPPSSAHHIIKEPITFPKKQIIFYPNGIISSGTIYITDHQARSAYALSSSVGQICSLKKYVYKNQQWTIITE